MLLQEAQLLYAEATSIPYDSTRINKARASLYRMGNKMGLPISDMVQRIKLNKKAVREAAETLAAQDENLQAIAAMGTLGTQLGYIMAHLHAPVENFNLPAFGSDLFGFLNTLAVLEMLPHVKPAKAV